MDPASRFRAKGKGRGRLGVVVGGAPGGKGGGRGSGSGEEKSGEGEGGEAERVSEEVRTVQGKRRGAVGKAQVRRTRTTFQSFAKFAHLRRRGPIF